jgi:hypothetical protein
MTFLVPDTALHGDRAEHVAHGLAQRLAAVEHTEHALLDIEAAIDQIGEQRGRDGRVLRRAVP